MERTRMTLGIRVTKAALLPALLLLPLFLLFLLLPVACTENELELRKNEGCVIVSPDWQEYTLPGSVACRVYAESGEATPYTYKEASADVFACSLPPGVYRLLAYNTDAAGVEFAAQQDIAFAEARILPGAQPGDLYAWDVERMEVRLRDTLNFTPVPRPLVKTLHLNFRLAGIGDIESIEGNLYGVYPSVCLLTGKPSAESVEAAPVTSVPFVGEVRQRLSAGNARTIGYEGVSSVRLFGLLDPQGGKLYDNRLKLNLRLPDHEVRQAEVDMNGTLSDILAQNGGEIPPEVPVKIEIEIKWVNSSLVASVKEWTLGEGTGGV